MTFATVWIHRPVATTLLMVGVLFLGGFAYTLLPIASLPSVDRPTIVVVAPLPGASPTTVASALSQPLETQLGQIAGLVEMGSFSGTGGTQITLQFDLSVDIDAAAGEVQAAINRAGPYLPSSWAWPPYYYKANPAGFSVIMLALTSGTMAPADLYDVADTVLAPKLSQLEGVARVLIAGADRAAVRVQVDPARLAQMRIPLEQVRAAILVGSANLPKGQVSGDGMRMTIEANDQLLTAAEYATLPVGVFNGTTILLRDVASVEDSVLNRKVAAWYKNEGCVVVFIYKQPDANVVRTVDQVKEALPGLRQWLPAAVDINVVFDRTTLIRAAVYDVEWTIGLAIGLVVVVTAVFLRQVRATLVPLAATPIALAGTLCGMFAAGYSLDNLTLMALAIAVGFVVDDAVIVVEEVVRRIDAGEAPLAAAASAVRLLGSTIASLTFAMSASLIPVLFMPDVIGRYFREFGLTLVIAVVASAIVSLTLTPMMCGHLLARNPRHKRSARDGWYVRSLTWVLKHPSVGLLVFLLVAAGSIWLFTTLPKGLMPTQDTGVALVRTVASANISFNAMEDLQRQVGAAVTADPDVGTLVSYIGEGNGSSLSIGTMVFALRNQAGYTPPLMAVIDRLRRRLHSIHGIQAFFTPMQDLNLGVQASAARYQYTLWGPDQAKVEAAGQQLVARMRRMPALIDVIGNWETTGLQLGLVMDRARASAFGITPVAIDNTLYDAFGQRQLNTLFLRNNYSRVILETKPSNAGPRELENIYLPGVKGQIPLSALARETRAHAPAWIRHSSQFPSVTVSFDLAAGAALGDAIRAITAEQAAIGLDRGVGAEFRGEAGEAVKAGRRQLALWLLAVVCVYIVLGVLYESLRHPVTILSTLPLGLSGGLLGLSVTGSTFTIMTSIGCILLLGMVMRNAILIVDQALDGQRTRGLNPLDAIVDAARVRLRPILMTMIAATLSALPLALGTGPGHELRQPLGIVVVAGLASAQILTLYITPLIYLAVERIGAGGRTKIRAGI